MNIVIHGYEVIEEATEEGRFRSIALQRTDGDGKFTLEIVEAPDRKQATSVLKKILKSQHPKGEATPEIIKAEKEAKAQKEKTNRELAINSDLNRVAANLAYQISLGEVDKLIAEKALGLIREAMNLLIDGE